MHYRTRKTHLFSNFKTKLQVISVNTHVHTRTHTYTHLFAKQRVVVCPRLRNARSPHCPSPTCPGRREEPIPGRSIAPSGCTTTRLRLLLLLG